MKYLGEGLQILGGGWWEVTSIHGMDWRRILMVEKGIEREHFC